jgi:hypothetical protein
MTSESRTAFYKGVKFWIVLLLALSFALAMGRTLGWY